MAADLLGPTIPSSKDLGSESESGIAIGVDPEMSLYSNRIVRDIF